VEPYAESYKEVDIDWGTRGNLSLREAAQAVRQLIKLRHLGIQSIFTRRILAKPAGNSSERLQTRAGRSAFIRIEEGKEAGRIYEIQKEELSIGRSRDRDIFLDDSAVDELHATIIHQGNAIMS
jgi:hypothetical protein